MYCIVRLLWFLFPGCGQDEYFHGSMVMINREVTSFLIMTVIT